MIIELDDYNAVRIAIALHGLLQEYNGAPQAEKLQQAYDEMMPQIVKNLTVEQFDRIKFEFELNEMIGKEPGA